MLWDAFMQGIERGTLWLAVKHLSHYSSHYSDPMMYGYNRCISMIETGTGIQLEGIFTFTTGHNMFQFDQTDETDILTEHYTHQQLAAGDGI